jgi:hypothetical protein
LLGKVIVCALGFSRESFLSILVFFGGI